MLNNFDHVHGVGVNCVAPHLVEGLVTVCKANANESKRILVYANSGEVWDARQGKRCWTAGEGAVGEDGMKVTTGDDVVQWRKA